MAEINEEFRRRNRLNGDSFGHVEFVVMVETQSKDMLEG